MTHMRPLVFHGSELEACDLAAAVEHNCDCARLRRTREPSEPTVCPAHAMLLGTCRADQRALDGLVYVRRALRTRLLEQEFSTPTTSAATFTQ